jgi:5-methyltetrahydrofolate--homocysteine methyltransferase
VRPTMAVKEEIYNDVINGDAEAVRALTLQAIAAGASADELLNEALIPAMTEVGERFERHEFYVPEMLIAARAMKSGVQVLRPLLAEAGAKPAGTVVMGTVSGDLHDIGKNLVVMMLEGTGLQVVDLGVDVSAGAFVQAVREHSPQILGMSALLTTTMLSMQTTIEALKEAGLRDQVVVMVGGAPLTQSYADEIGADLFAADASSAARKAREAVL